MDRRKFLKRAVKILLSFFGLFFLPVFAYLYPSRIKERSLKFLLILNEYELPQRGVKRVEFTYEQGQRKFERHAFVVRSETGITALSPVCTHLGCLVSYDRNKNEFLCPCHGGRYNIKGEVTGGPPPASMNMMPLEVRDGKVYLGIRV